MLCSGIRDVILLHGVRKPQELYYAPEIKKSAGSYVACLSETADNHIDHYAGRVTDYLQKELPQDIYDFYLCGGGEMIRDVILLVDERFPGSYIYTEPFY